MIKKCICLIRVSTKQQELEGQKEKVQPLLKHERVDWIFKADYREGKPLDNAVRNLLNKLGVDNKLIHLSNEQKKEIVEWNNTKKGTTTQKYATMRLHRRFYMEKYFFIVFSE